MDAAAAQSYGGVRRIDKDYVGDDGAAAAHPNATTLARQGATRKATSEERMLESAEDASSAQVINLARPALLLLEKGLCEEAGCEHLAVVCCTGACCRLTGKVLCFIHDAAHHMLAPSRVRTMLAIAPCTDLEVNVTTKTTVLYTMRVDEFVESGEAVTIPLPLPEASMEGFPQCGSLLSVPVSWNRELSSSLKYVDMGCTYRVGRVLRWRCTRRTPEGVCAHEWERNSNAPHIVGATSLTPSRMHCVIADNVRESHVRQRGAARVCPRAPVHARVCAHVHSHAALAQRTVHVHTRVLHEHVRVSRVARARA